MPPRYMQWFQANYPKVKLDKSPSNKYVLQLLRGLQGDKSIGRKWYLLLKDILTKFGFYQCVEEPALYYYCKNDAKFILNTSTDDFLCAYTHQETFESLCEYFKEFFSITTETGTTLNYLNLRIIQTSYGISYDQTDHIQRKIINKHFPPSKIEGTQLKSVHTPFRTDSQFEIDLLETLPANAEQLKLLEEQHGASYASIIGDIMHVYVWSRPDVGYSTTRLSRYIHAPSSPSFMGLKRILRYLATHTHRPIMYPRASIDGIHTIRVDFDTPKFEEIELPNSLIALVDSDHARDNNTRRSCHCVLVLLAGVVVDWKMQQQRVVALHSTDSEIRGALQATKQGLTLQHICKHIGMKPTHYIPLRNRRG